MSVDVKYATRATATGGREGMPAARTAASKPNCRRPRNWAALVATAPTPTIVRRGLFGLLHRRVEGRRSALKVKVPTPPP